MASTQTWSEYNGAGQTETASRSECNWKNIDDSTTAYTSSPVTAGNNSFTKYQALKFGGTWNSLSALTYKIDVNSEQAGAVTIKGAVVTSYTTPSTSASGDGAMSTSGVSANFNTSATPFVTGTASTTAGGTMYANALRTQMQTTGAAGPGDITAKTITASWTES